MVLTLTMSVVDLVAAELHQSVKSTAVTHVGGGVSGSLLHHAHRVPRQAAQSLTADQRTEVVEHHNVLRAMEGANNMQLMV